MGWIPLDDLDGLDLFGGALTWRKKTIHYGTPLHHYTVHEGIHANSRYRLSLEYMFP